MKKSLIGADHFKNFSNLGGLAKRKENILFTLNKVSLENDNYITDLFVINTGENKTKQLTHSIDIETYKWMDDEHIIFTAVIDDEDRKLREKNIPLTTFYKMNIETEKMDLLFRVNKSMIDFTRISDEEYIFLCNDNLMDDGYFRQAKGDWEEFARIKEAEADYFIAEEVPYWTNSSGYCNGKRGRVFCYNAGKLEQISPDNLNITAITESNSAYVAYCGVESGKVQNTAGKLFQYDIKGKVISAIDDSETYIYTSIAAVSEDQLLVCRSDRKLHGEYQDEYIDLIHLQDNTWMRKNAKGDYHIYDNVVCDVTYLSNWLNKIQVTDRGFYFIATENESSKVFFWDNEKELPQAVTKAKGKVIDYEVIEEKLYFIAMRGLDGSELYSMDIHEGEETPITAFNAHLQEEYQYSAVEELPFVNKNNVEIQGWFMKPVVFEEGKKYPTILFIHGGPQCAFGEVFNHDMQLMTASGYGVLFCNPTGSEGRGGDFADIRMKYGTIDYDDLITFTKHAVATLDWVDEDNLGVTGGSYGGIMTNWIIGHTDMFKVAISDRGVCNNISDFGLSDIGVSFGLDTFETTPWGNIDFLWDTSPLKYAPNIKTPVLLIHGVEDYRCTYDSALQLHTALTYFGTPSKVIAFKGENHELCRSGQPKHRIRRLVEMVNWFNNYTE